MLANLYLYFYESAYVSRLELKEGLVAAGTFHNTFRLIDDVLLVDNPLMAAALSKPYEEGGLYPAVLELKQTSKSSRVEWRISGVSTT